jgi:hypothetical protein
MRPLTTCARSPSVPASRPSWCTTARSDVGPQRDRLDEVDEFCLLLGRALEEASASCGHRSGKACGLVG